MSNHNEKDLLTQAMRDRAAGVGGHPIDMEAVRGRARGIRRRRNAVRGAVAAVVAAIAVPAGLTVGTALDSPTDPAPGPVASGTPTQGGSPSVTLPEGPTELTLEGLAQGAPAEVPYVLVDERTLVTRGGTAALPEALSMMTPYAGGWLAVGSERRPDEVVWLDQDLEITKRSPGSTSLATNGDGTRVAYAERQSDGTMTLFNAPTNGGDPLAWTVEAPEGVDVQPLGFLDQDTVVYQTGGESPRVSMATVGGEVSPVEGFLYATHASEANGLVAGVVSYDDTESGSCSGVKEPDAATLLWEQCDLTIASFSADGRFVIGYPGYSDGAGPTSLYVLDARTGERLVEFSPEAGGRTVVGISQSAWEDGDSIIAVVQEGDAQALVRANLDGTLLKATATYQVTDMSMRFLLSTAPRR